MLDLQTQTDIRLKVLEMNSVGAYNKFKSFWLL